jgi:hypothetical protein
MIGIRCFKICLLNYPSGLRNSSKDKHLVMIFVKSMSQCEWIQLNSLTSQAQMQRGVSFAVLRGNSGCKPKILDRGSFLFFSKSFRIHKKKGKIVILTANDNQNCGSNCIKLHTCLSNLYLTKTRH